MKTHKFVVTICLSVTLLAIIRKLNKDKLNRGKPTGKTTTAGPVNLIRATIYIIYLKSIVEEETCSTANEKHK